VSTQVYAGATELQKSQNAVFSAQFVTDPSFIPNCLTPTPQMRYLERAKGLVSYHSSQVSPEFQVWLKRYHWLGAGDEKSLIQNHSAQP
jgi:hypothetical protein